LEKVHALIKSLHNLNLKNLRLCKKQNQDKYIVEYGHNTYKGYTLSSPIKVSDRIFSTEKKAVRFAKKIVPVDYIKIEKKLG